MRFAVTLVLLLAGCEFSDLEPDPEPVFSGQRHPWYRPGARAEGPEVPAAEVPLDRRAEALELLGDREMVEVGLVTARRLHPASPAGPRLFLCRAVRLRCTNGTDSLSARLGARDRLVVDWHCMGSQPLPMDPSAALVALEAPPRSVLPRVGMTQ